MALTLVTSDLIHGLDYSKLTGTIPTWNQNTTGNAATATLAAGATILANTRNINGVAFNGSTNITIADATKLPLAGGTLTGALVGTSATFNTGANRGIVLDNDSVDTPFNVISLNGTNVKGSYSGIAGGGTGNDNLYLNSADGVIVQTGSSFTPKLTILTGGNVGIGNTNPSSYHSPADNLVIGTSGDNGFTIVSGTTSKGTICFADGTSGGAQYTGFIDYDHSNDSMRLGTNGGNTRLTISSGGDASFNGNVSLADTKYIQLNNTSTDWQLRADNAGKFIVQTSGGSEFFKIRNNGEIAFGNGTAFNQFFNVRSSSTSQSLINIGTSDNSEFLNVGVFGSAGYVMMENAAALNIGTGGVTRLSISSGGVITTGGSISNPFKITANPGTRSLKLTSASTNFGTFISWLRANETYEKAYLGFTSTSNDVFEINNRENADMTFHTNTTERMRISSGGEYSFGTPSSVTYSHGSNDGFHLRTGLELGFGNGNNNRPDFGINATGSGGGASLNIYCGEGSDDVDIQIAPNAVMQFNSGGIKFGSSGELLNAYEEGTWVVTLPNSSGASITTYRARYTIIGNVCHFQLYVIMSSIPSDNNTFFISLPITPDSTTNDYTGVSMGYCSSFNTNSWLPITHAALAYIYFHRNDGNGAVITNAQASGLPQIILSGHYYV